jgi:selenocysteine-specific elongation factor
LLLSGAVWERFMHDSRAVLSAFHAAHPLRAGMPREELKSRLRMTSSKTFNALVGHAVAERRLNAAGAIVHLPEHRVTFTPAQQAKVDALLADFSRDPYNTPSFKDCAARVGDEVLNALIERGALNQVSPEVLFLAQTYTAMLARVTTHLQAYGKITVAQVRDLFTTSRKYALALMEYLDTQGVTKRVGDERVLKT